MEHDHYNQSPNLNTAPNPAPSVARPTASKNDSLHKLTKISLIVFIVSLILLAIFGIVDVWGGFGNNSNDVFAKLEGSLGILTGASFVLSMVLRVFTGRKVAKP